MINTDACFRLADDVRYRRILDEAVAVRQETNEVIVVNEVSASILVFLEVQGGATVASLIDYLAGAYEVDRQILEEDTVAHIKELMDAGIVVHKGD